LTENDLTWYGASYIVPSILRLTTGEPSAVTVSVKNTGSIRWHASGENYFALAYFWLTGDGEAIKQDHVEVLLPHPVAPGETVQMTISLETTLPPGEYQLVWGMLQRDILWFRHRDSPEAYSAVYVERATNSSASTEETVLETVSSPPGGDASTLPPTIGRLDLWSVALRMWLERPLLGVGPDNFRHLYGNYLNLSDFDRRLHANNLYLELLAGWGLAGTITFGALIWVVARRWYFLWQTTTGTTAIWSICLGGSLLVFFLHGLLDYFLEFVPLYLTFWTVTALLVALERVVVNETHDTSA
jgi:hypothetical protein